MFVKMSSYHNNYMKVLLFFLFLLFFSNHFIIILTFQFPWQLNAVSIIFKYTPQVFFFSLQWTKVFHFLLKDQVCLYKLNLKSIKDNPLSWTYQYQIEQHFGYRQFFFSFNVYQGVLRKYTRNDQRKFVWISSIG